MFSSKLYVKCLRELKNSMFSPLQQQQIYMRSGLFQEECDTGVRVVFIFYSHIPLSWLTSLSLSWSLRCETRESLRAVTDIVTPPSVAICHHYLWDLCLAYRLTSVTYFHALETQYLGSSFWKPTTRDSIIIITI